MIFKELLKMFRLCRVKASFLSHGYPSLHENKVNDLLVIISEVYPLSVHVGADASKFNYFNMNTACEGHVLFSKAYFYQEIVTVVSKI
jgi:hypothetical protein